MTGSAPDGNKTAREGESLQRRLTERQLSMIAIGGAIGVGLFLGSGVTIRLAGPGVLITYVAGAVVAGILACAVAEMAVVHPVAGSFGIYAEKYLSPWSGFAVRATYGIVQIIAIGAEVTAVGIYFAYWFPAVPQWIWVLAVSAGLVAVNSMQVGRFGEFEYWFALIKVVAIVAFILLGFALVAGIGPWPAIGLRNLTAHGGFLPNGWSGVWLALTLGITSYMGVEVIAVTAGEAQQPEKSIPRAMRTIVLRLILFYILALFISLAVSPWNATAGAGLSGSPFVRTFAAVGIPFAASIMIAVVITAALSSANTNLYLSTRMLFSLARGGYAPAWLGNVSPAGVPLRALVVSTAGMAAAVLLAIYAPSNAFLLLYGTAVAGMFFVWIVILLSHLNFRKTIGAELAARLPLRLPAHPVPTITAIAAVLAISATTFWVDGLRYTIPAFIPMLGLISIAYFRSRRTGQLAANAARISAPTAAEGAE